MDFSRITVFLSFFLLTGCQSIPLSQNVTHTVSATEPFEKKIFSKDPDIWTIKQDVYDSALNAYLQKVMDKLWPYYKGQAERYYVFVDNNPYIQSLIIVPPSNRVYVSYGLLNFEKHANPLG